MTTTTTVLDLTKDYPRSPLVELEGFPWLARLIDKVRALKAGKIGPYTPFPCGGDGAFLGAIGVEPEALKAVIDGGASDAEIASWVKANHKPASAEQVAAYKARLTASITDAEYLGYLNESKQELAAARPDLDMSKIDNFTRLICAEEGHPCPGL
jgi:hypothetical protein